MKNIALENAAEMLATRTMRTFKVSHWLETPGLVRCLDFNITAPTRQELEALLVAAMGAIAPDAVLPSAPKSLWMEFAKLPVIANWAVKTDLSPRGMVVVAIRGKQ